MILANKLFKSALSAQSAYKNLLSYFTFLVTYEPDKIWYEVEVARNLGISIVFARDDFAGLPKQNGYASCRARAPALWRGHRE